MANYIYTTKDVIWNADDDSCLKYVGKLVYAGNSYAEAIHNANNRDKRKLGYLTRTGVISLSTMESKHIFGVQLISGKEVLKEVNFVIPSHDPVAIPFNFNDADIRNFVRDKWIIKKDKTYEKKITYMSVTTNGNWRIQNLSPEELFTNWEFLEPINNGTKIIGHIL